jgi:hypothetical protein
VTPPCDAHRAVKAIDGATLLDDVRAFLLRFVAFPSQEALDAVTLWVVHTHLTDALESTPRLALLSPEPSSGKTRTLDILELLVRAPMTSVSASPPTLFRSLGQNPRTLLFDEVDTIFGCHGKGDPAEDLRAILNAGHRRGATVPRCAGLSVVEFPVFAAAALAGLGDLPDTVMSRSVVVRMRLRLPSERVEPFRRRVHGPEGRGLHERLTRWADQVLDEVRDAWPEMPPGVVDRPADVWEPLLAVADAAGGHWLRTARTACTALLKVSEGREASLGVKLLIDIRQIFNETGSDRMFTDDLLRRLHAVEESPWGGFRGKPLDARQLAHRLAPYDVKPHQLRIGDKKARGYSVPGSDSDGGGLHDAFNRYLSPVGSGTDGTSGTTHVSSCQTHQGTVERTMYRMSRVAANLDKEAMT